MKTIIEKQNEYLFMIKEGYGLKSKITFFISFLQVPLRYFCKLIGIRLEHKLIFEATLKNKDGIFVLGKNRGNARLACTFFEKEMRKYFKLDSGIFVDIGANIGKYTIGIANRLKSHGEVIAIEPEKENFKLLLRNIELNNLRNVSPLKLACSNKNTKLKLYLSDSGNDSSGHSIRFMGWRHERKGFEDVEARTLDFILNDLKKGKVDLIKIDVEGGEIEVLGGALKTLKKSHPKIIIETGSLQKVREILNPFGYRIERINDGNYFAY